MTMGGVGEGVQLRERQGEGRAGISLLTMTRPSSSPVTMTICAFESVNILSALIASRCWCPLFHITVPSVLITFTVLSTEAVARTIVWEGQREERKGGFILC